MPTTMGNTNIINKGGNIMTKLKSGEIAPQSGMYQEMASNGRCVGTYEVSKGDTMPPTQSQDHYFVICN